MLQRAGGCIPRDAIAALQAFALVLALLCGALLRRLQSLRAAAARPSTDASARLARLEAAAQVTGAQLATTTRLLDRASTRSRLAAADVRAPLAALQGSAGRHAELLAALAAQQEAVRRQVEDCTELIGALQGVAAKQFQVSVDALSQVRQQQAALQAQQQRLDEAAAALRREVGGQLQRQELKLDGLGVRLAQQAAQQAATGSQGGGAGGGDSIGGGSEAGAWGGSSGPSRLGSIPIDPWAAPAAHAGNGMSQQAAGH